MALPVALVAFVWFAVECAVRVADHLWGSPGTSVGHEPFVLLGIALGAGLLALGSRVRASRRCAASRPRRPGDSFTPGARNAS